MITFTLYGPTGASVETETATVNGPGTYTTPGGWLPSARGTYQWVAVYSGDANNNGASTIKGNAPEIAVGSGATVVNGALYLVGGSTTNDQVTINATAGSPSITVNAMLNGVSASGSYTPNALYLYGFGGSEYFQAKGPISIPVFVSAGNGNDNVQFASANGNNTVTLGNGNDTVTLGGGNNTVTVGNGKDILTLGGGNNLVVEGNGQDSVQAGNGDNLIVGGLGKHTIQVGNGRNILIDGAVNDSIAALDAILIEWVQSSSNAGDIRNKLQGLVTYNTTNANTLQAGSGLDWFWANYAKDSLNKKSTDLLN
jgi:Ca2+-binding RTX toxin-like protein